MRLIKLGEDGQFSLKEFIGEDTPPYGILSHTWGADVDEVTLKDLVGGTAMGKVGYDKLRFCAKQAAADGLSWFWIDTCSIDKTSSAELSEAINSMYRWYYTSTKCYVYLSDVSFDKSEQPEQSETDERAWEALFQKSRWFTRGWTLQELLAPKSVEFFSKEGMRLGDKRSLGPTIHKITGITQRALQDTFLYEFSVDERMSWAANRKTTREEDFAYSLLGIFDVNMPLLYGEGRKKALYRLRREIRDSLPNDPPALLNNQLQSLELEKSVSADQSKIQSGPSFIYTSYAPLDNPPIAAACPSPKEMNVMVLGDDSTLKSMTLENGIPITKNWQSDGKWFSDTPLMISTKKSRLEIFAPTPYGKVLYQEIGTGLILKEQWESLGDTIKSPLTGVSWGPNRFDIFGLGESGQLMHKSLVHGNWLPSKDAWENVGGEWFLPPVAVSAVPGQLHVFCVKNYGSSLYRKAWDGSTWTPNSPNSWDEAHISCMSPPAVVATDRNRLDIFVRTPEELLHFARMDGKDIYNQTWFDIKHPGEGTWISRPAAVLSRAGRVELFCLRTDNELYHRSFSPRENIWDPSDKWNSLGGDFISAPTAIISRNGKIYVFCKGYDEEIYYMDLADKEWKSLGDPN